MKNGQLIEASMVAFGGVIIPLAASFPAQAQTLPITVASGVVDVYSNQISSKTTEVDISGGGTAILTNTGNLQSGTIRVDGGTTLAFNADSVLGATSAIVIGNSSAAGILDFNEICASCGSGGTSANYQLEGVLADDRGILINGSGTSGGAIIITNSGTVYSAASSTATVSSSYAAELEGVISGTGQLTVQGGGTLLLAGRNVWTGGMVVESGTTVGIFTARSLGALTNSNVISGGTLEFEDHGYTFSNNFTIDNVSTTVSGVTSVTESTIQTNGFRDVLSASSSGGITSGVIGGSGGLIVADSSTSGTGVLVLEGTETYTGGTIVNGGTLELNSGTVQGDVTVTSTTYTTYALSGSGTTEVVSSAVTSSTGNMAGIGTINGNLIVENGGSVTPGINGSGTLTVGSAFDLLSGSKLDIDVGSGSVGELVANGSGSEINSAAALDLKFVGYTSAGTYQYLQAASGISGGFTSATTTDDLYSVGLESNVTSSGTGGEIILTQRSSLPSTDLPTIVAAVQNVAVEDAQFANRFILDRLQSVRTTSLAQREQVALSDHHQVRNLSPYGLWVVGLGGFGSASGSNGAPGYTHTKYGMAAGFDGVAGPGWVYGGALSYTHNSVSQSGGGTGDVGTPRIQAYTGWWRGPYAIDLTVGDGWASLTSHRSYSAALTNILYGQSVTTDFSGTANGVRASNELTAAAQFSGNYLLGYTWAISPAAGVKFARLSTTGLTETGSDYFGFAVAKQDVNSVRPFVDVEASRRYYFMNGSALLPEVRVGVEDEVGNSNSGIQAKTFGDSYVWTIQGQKPAALNLDLDLGLSYETSKSQSFSIKFMGTESSGGSDQTLMAQYGLQF